MTQTLYPAGDISTGSWATAPLWSKVDDAAPGTADYINLPNNTTGACRLGTLVASDAGSITDIGDHTNHIVAIYAQRTGSRTTTLVTTLYQGTTAIAAGTASATTWGTLSFTLGTAQAALISDYKDLRVDINCTASGSSNQPQVAAVWVTIPGYSVYRPTGAEGTQGETSDAVTLTLILPVVNLTVGEGSQGEACDLATLGHIAPVTAGEAAQTETCDAVTLQYIQPDVPVSLAPAENTQVEASDAVTLGTKIGIELDSAEQTHRSDAAILYGISPILFAEANMAQASDGATLSESAQAITAGENMQAQLCDSASMLFSEPTYVLTAGESSQAQVSDTMLCDAISLLIFGEGLQIQGSDTASVQELSLILPGRRAAYRPDIRVAGNLFDRVNYAQADRELEPVDVRVVDDIDLRNDYLVASRVVEVVDDRDIRY